MCVFIVQIHHAVVSVKLHFHPQLEPNAETDEAWSQIPNSAPLVSHIKETVRLFCASHSAVRSCEPDSACRSNCVKAFVPVVVQNH